MTGSNFHAAVQMFGDHAGAFQQYLADQYYSGKTIDTYLLAVCNLAAVMQQQGVLASELDAETAAALVDDDAAGIGHRRQKMRMARRFAVFLREHGAGKLFPPPTRSEIARQELQEEYEAYLHNRRGLRPRSIYHCWRFADRFLAFRFGDNIGELTDIRASDIASFLQSLTERKTPYRDKTASTHLRSFFRFLFATGKTTRDLSLAVPSIAQRHGTRLPRHLSAQQVERVIAAVKINRSPCPRRNLAMILVQARLGLRAPDVGEAIADYIKHERVAHCRPLFVAHRAPHKAFKDGQVLNEILKAAFRSTGLTPPVPYVGSHILRHSLAANLVKQGASLEEIGDVLRHRSRASTMIYARMDVDGLRSLALPWPIAAEVRS